MNKFEKTAQTIIKNAAGYKSLAACRLMAGRVKEAYAASGSYGCQRHLFQEALAAIQDRGTELYFRAKYGTQY